MGEAQPSWASVVQQPEQQNAAGLSLERLVAVSATQACQIENLEVFVDAQFDREVQRAGPPTVLKFVIPVADAARKQHASRMAQSVDESRVSVRS